MRAWPLEPICLGSTFVPLLANLSELQSHDGENEITLVLCPKVMVRRAFFF